MSSHVDQFAYRCSPDERNGRRGCNDWSLHSDSDLSLSQFWEGSNSPLMTMRRFTGEQDSAIFTVMTEPDIPKAPPFQASHDTPYPYPTANNWPYQMHTAFPSPSLSGPSSTYSSSSASDRQSTPHSPPDPSLPMLSSEIFQPDNLVFDFGGGHDLFGEQKHPVSYPCVALHEVQSYEDPQPEKLGYDEDAACYGPYASAPHEGYQPAEPNEDVDDIGVESESDAKDDQDYTPQSPKLRRRRPQSVRTVTSPRVPSRVTKPSGHKRRSSAPQSRVSANGYSKLTAEASKRAFPCALANYGCDSTFGSKNEWKRHINTQHMRLAYWRCDQCDHSTRKPNDFNRKDLFIQHVRRMHPAHSGSPTKKASKHSNKVAKGSPEEQSLNFIAERCFKPDRSPPEQSGCHFCGETFETFGKGGQGQWDKRLEHLAQHMEHAKNSDLNVTDPDSWEVDSRLEHWLVENKIIERALGGDYALA